MTRISSRNIEKYFKIIRSINGMSREKNLREYEKKKMTLSEGGRKGGEDVLIMRLK